VAPNVLKIGGDVDPLKPEGQVEVSRNLQIATAALDSTGLCLFVAFSILDMPESFMAMVEMINGCYGLDLGPDEVNQLGMAVLSMERKFNEAAGFSSADDRLPYWMRTDKLPPHDTVFSVPDEELDEVFNFVQ
jgi:aldehyde:ferredoxin oxidoreductase